ncbi:MAG: hypothetical protein ACOYLH_02110 [Flavobacteriales bacterium]
MVALFTRISLAILFISLVSCGGGNIFNRKNEGIIFFDVSFPYEQNSIRLELYPKEMTFEFHKDQMHASISSSFGVVATDIYIDNKNKKFTQILKSFGEHYGMSLDESNIKTWTDRQQITRIESTADTLTIAGFLCKKSIAYLPNDSLPPIQLYFTDEIKIDQSNWWNQFHEIEGCLLAYEVEQYGKRMRLVAREVRFQDVAPESFTIPSGTTAVDADGMYDQMDKLMKEFMGAE